MKNLVCTALIAIGIGIGMSACVTEEATEDLDPASLSEEEQAVEACQASYGCILTAIRDGNYFLIDTCIAVLCTAQE